MRKIKNVFSKDNQMLTYLNRVNYVLSVMPVINLGIWLSVNILIFRRTVT